MAQARDLSSMHAPMFGLRACLNFFGQGSTTLFWHRSGRLILFSLFVNCELFFLAFPDDVMGNLCRNVETYLVLLKGSLFEASIVSLHPVHRLVFL